MADEKAMQAIERIERALVRIAAAAEAAADGARHRPRNDNELLELRQVHQALRGKVEGAIAQIDRLLAGEKG